MHFFPGSPLDAATASLRRGMTRSVARSNRTVRFLALTMFMLTSTACNVGYIARQGTFELSMLASARPVARLQAEGGLSAGQEQRLALLPDIKAYGAELGLSATRNYETLATGREWIIWNISACDPLSFTPRTWTFPIVGKVPYLGFFSEAEARAEAAELETQGYETYVRTAGTFSTLGWFRDPLLPNMLRWSEADLAETVFHELAHATLWVPGSVPFNESFASFVGETAAVRYLADRHGADSEQLLSYQREDRDWRRYEQVLHGLYENLDAAYRDSTITVEERRARKAELYASLPDRVRAAGLEDADRYLRSIRRTPWNNARMIQFKAYNSHDELFAAVLDRNHGDLRAFIDDVQRITRGRKDPFQALADAAVKNP